MTIHFEEYLKLMEEHPELFENEGEDIIRIITHRERIQEGEAKLKRELKRRNLPLSWSEIGILVDDPFFLIIRDLVEFPDGGIGGYIRFIHRAGLEGGQAVVILPVVGGKILVLRNFRHATRGWELEIPRGFGEKGISAEENAKKELMEETRLKARTLVELGILHSDTGAISLPVALFYAEISESDLKALELEEITSSALFLAPSEFEEMIRKGKITDAFSISAYAMAKYNSLL